MPDIDDSDVDSTITVCEVDEDCTEGEVCVCAGLPEDAEPSCACKPVAPLPDPDPAPDAGSEG